MNKPFFSVIVPLHNAEPYMRRGLDSIKSQSFSDYELLLICDACSDNTATIAREYSDKVFEVDFACSGTSRSFGLDQAIGEWILWMDDDDWYLPDAFQIIHDEIIKHDEFDILAYSFDWYGVGITKQMTRLYPAIWCKAWRREFVGDTRFPNWSHGDDGAFSNSLHSKARIVRIEDTLYHYAFMREGSISDKIRKGQLSGDDLPPEKINQIKHYEQWLKDRFADLKGEI